MRVIKEGGFVEGFFRNTLFPYLPMFLVMRNPKTDCALVWGMFWNFMIITLCVLLVFWFPIGFIGMFFTLPHDIILMNGFGIQLIEPRYFSEGIGLALDVVEEYSHPVVAIACVFMVGLGFAAGLFIFMGIVVVVVGSIILLVKMAVVRFYSLFSKGNVTTDSGSELLEIVVDRIRGSKEKWCRPVAFESDMNSQKG